MMARIKGIKRIVGKGRCRDRIRIRVKVMVRVRVFDLDVGSDGRNPDVLHELKGFLEPSRVRVRVRVRVEVGVSLSQVGLMLGFP